jgi:hypothetical protein
MSLFGLSNEEIRSAQSEMIEQGKALGMTDVEAVMFTRSVLRRLQEISDAMDEHVACCRALS